MAGWLAGKACLVALLLAGPGSGYIAGTDGGGVTTTRYAPKCRKVYRLCYVPYVQYSGVVEEEKEDDDRIV